MNTSNSASFFPTSFPELSTERLQLKQITEAHLEEFMPISWYKGKPMTDRDQALKIIQKSAQYFETKTGISWGMFLDGKLIGHIGYYRGFANATGEIGYVLNPSHWGKGYMIEATNATIQYGVNKMGLTTITAFTASNNKPSIKLLKKLGFKPGEIADDGFQKFELLPN